MRIGRWRKLPVLHVNVRRSSNWEPQPRPPGRTAGLREISGTSQELSDELTAELLQWLRAKDGLSEANKYSAQLPL